MTEYRDGKRVLLNPNGQLVQVDPGEAEAKVASGLYADASKDQVAAYDAVAQQRVDAARQAELLTPGAMLETGIKSGLNAFAAPAVWAAQKMGLGDIRNIGMSDEEAAAYHEREQKLSEYNPVSSFVGSTTGQLVGLKGAGGFAGGVRAGLGATKAIGTVARAGMEGAYLGTTQAMEDPNAAAEHVLASGALGAALGAGTSALFGMAGKSLAKVFGNPMAARAAELTEASMERDAVAKGTMAKLWDKATSALSGAPKELLEEVGPTGTRRGEAIAAAEGFDRWADEAAIKLGDASNEADKGLQDVTRVVNDHQLKEAGIREIAGPTWDTVERRRFGSAMLDTVNTDFARAVEDVNAEGLPVGSRRQLDMMQRQMGQAVQNISDQHDAASRYIALDQIKRKLQKTVLQMRTDAQNPRLPVTSFEHDALLSTASRIEEVQENLRQNLMDPRSWGSKVASAQREINEVWAEGAIDALDAFGHQFQRWTGGRDYDTGRKIFEADPAKLLASLKSIGTANGKIAERTMGDYLYHLDKLVERIGDKFELGPAARRSLENARAKFAEMSDLYSSAKERLTLANKFKELESYKAGGLLSHSTMLGGFAGHGPGAAIGSAIGALGNPAATAHMLEGLSKSTQRIGNLTSGVGTWLSKGAQAIPSKSTARNIGVSAALQLWKGNHKTDNEAYEERVKAVQTANAGSIGPHIEGLPPEIQAAAGGQMATALQYLQSVLPADAGNPSIMNPTRKVLASVPEQKKFAKAWATVIDPSTAIKDLKRGQLSPIQVQALKTVYPRIYDDLRMNTLNGIAQADADGVKIPLHTRQQLDLLLDLHGAGQPAFSDAIVGIVQNGLAQASAGKGPARQKTPQLAKSMVSSSKQLLGA